jgi:hypothetical protein
MVARNAVAKKPGRPIAKHVSVRDISMKAMKIIAYQVLFWWIVKNVLEQVVFTGARRAVRILINLMKAILTMTKSPQPGQTWVMRNGKMITVDAIVPEDPHPVKSGQAMCWQSNGRYWDDGFNSRLDLVNLVEK